jgi:hypothetical protein
VQITVTRTDDRQYVTVIRRDDGVMLRVPGYGFMRALPHDLAHLVVETSLRLKHGFWGTAAAGAKFPGMEFLEGRQRPHADTRSAALLKANALALSEAERWVAAFETIVGRGLESRPQLCAKILAEATAAFRKPARQGSHQDVVAVCSAWRTMQSRWETLGPGESLETEWRT